MQSMLEHIKFLETLKKYKISTVFIKQCNYTDLRKFCDNITSKSISYELYQKNVHILSEMINNNAFVDYAIELYNKGIELDRLDYLLEILQENQEEITDYSIVNIFQTLNSSSLYKETYYSYLKYFSHKVNSKEEH